MLILSNEACSKRSLVFTMRSRPFVICTRLSAEEFEMWQRILRKVEREFRRPMNRSEAFRKALEVVNANLKWEAMELFYANLDV
jgi:hypothetical protein